MKNNKNISVREIVAVSVILIVLALVMAPAITDTPEKAQKKMCMSNMGVLARAFQLYLDDNDGRFPRGGNVEYPYDHMSGDWVWFDGTCGYSHYLYVNPGPPPSVPWTWWATPSKGSLWKYTDQNAQTYMCPADSHAVDPHFTTHGAFGLSYTMNCNLQREVSRDIEQGSTPAFISEIVSPSRMVLLSEQCNGAPYYYGGHEHSLVEYPNYDGLCRWQQTVPTTRHMGGGNFALCDGHVKWVRSTYQRKLVFYRDGTVSAPSKYVCPWPPVPL